MCAWHAKITGEYARESIEAYENAVAAYGLLSSYGWTLNAFCGMWSNVGFESGYNPWRWERDIVLNFNDPDIDDSRVHGYGLPQFTPSGKYLHDSNAMANSYYAPNYNDRQGLATDGYSQLTFINYHADYYSTSSYPLSYASYKASMATPEYLAAAWMHNYERPQSYAGQSSRERGARWWYDTLSGTPPTPPDPPTPGSGGTKLKFMLYLKPQWKRGL